MLSLTGVIDRLNIPYTDTSRDRTIGWLSLGVMVIASSTYNSFAKTLTDAVSPITLVLLSEMLTMFFVLLSFGVVPTFQRLLKLPRAQLKPLLAIGVLSGILAPLMWFQGLHHSSVVNASLFSNTEMLFLTILAVVLLKESFTRAHALSLATILAGLLVIVLKGFTQSIELQSGDLLLTLSCLTYGFGSIIFRRYLNHADPQVVILCRSLTAVSAFFLFSPFIPHTLPQDVAAFPVQAVPVLLGFGFVSRFLNGFSFYEAMERLPLTTVSLSLNFPVIGSILFGAWMLGERVESYHWVGGALIIAGALLLELTGSHGTKSQREKHLLHGHPRRI